MHYCADKAVYAGKSCAKLERRNGRHKRQSLWPYIQNYVCVLNLEKNSRIRYKFCNISLIKKSSLSLKCFLLKNSHLFQILYATKKSEFIWLVIKYLCMQNRLIRYAYGFINTKLSCANCSASAVFRAMPVDMRDEAWQPACDKEDSGIEFFVHSFIYEGNMHSTDFNHLATATLLSTNFTVKYCYVTCFCYSYLLLLSLEICLCVL